ncbi:MAG: tRNA (adenosine(37)-N6)-threonylcarbamoyltransferase complex ATPase subunit type 1 TsaE [Terriglobales bacterium]
MSGHAEAVPALLRSFDAQSEAETQAFGRRLAAALRPPALVLLQGELGAGKTRLVKGLAEGLQVAEEDDVVSPSYTLVHEYRSPGCTLHHVDLYRLEGSAQLATLGLEDILPGGITPSSVVAVEWGAGFPLFRGWPRWLVSLEITGEETRHIAVQWLPAGAGANRRQQE